MSGCDRAFSTQKKSVIMKSAMPSWFGRCLLQYLSILVLAGFLSACGTTVDLTRSVEGEGAAAEAPRLALTSSQQSLQLLADQVQTPPWTRAPAQEAWMGTFASVLVNGMKVDDANAGEAANLRLSQAELYLQEIQADGISQADAVAVMHADMAQKIEQAQNLLSAAETVMNDYRINGLAGSAYAGDLYRRDVEQARILQEDMLIQARREERIIESCFDALDSQRQVFVETIGLLNALADAKVAGPRQDELETLAAGLDQYLVQISELETAFSSAIANTEAHLSRVAQQQQ